MNISIEGDGTFSDFTKINSIPITTGSQRETFHNAHYTIVNVSENTSIKFSESDIDHTFVIDNVKVTKIPVISIAESADNHNTIAENDKKLVMVETARTLTGGIWNTLCLPFDVTMADMELALGDGQDIQMRTFTGYADKVMAFSEATTVEAGTPFLIKLNTTVKNPTFHGVTVSDVPAKTVEHGGVSFVGTYSPIALATDGTNLFITTRNTLASPGVGTNTMNGLRAYIVVPTDFNPSGARLMMDDGETTAISNLAQSVEAMPQATYDLKGQRVENSRHGLYIVNGKLTLVK